MDLENLNMKMAEVARKTGLDIIIVGAGDHDAVLIVKVPERYLQSGEKAEFKIVINEDDCGETLSEARIAQAVCRGVLNYLHRVSNFIITEVWCRQSDFS